MESLPETSSAAVPFGRRLRFLVWPPREPELLNAGRAGEIVIAKARLVVFALLLPPSIATCLRNPSEPSGWLGIATAIVCIAIGLEVLRRARAGNITRTLQVVSTVLDISLITGYHALLFMAGEIGMVLQSRVTFALYPIAIIGAALRYDGQLVRLAGVVAGLQYLAIVAWAHAAERINAVAPNFYGDSTVAGQVEELFILLMATVVGSILVERARELRLSGIRDPLTKLANRSYFAERFEAELQSSMTLRGTAAVAMLDIDHFKSVNDTYGHDAGDAVLRHVAVEMRKSLRAGDLVARLGGEEFALFLGDTTPESARGRLDSLRVALAQGEVTSGDRRIRITVSIGIAMSPDDGLDTQALLLAADARLLLGKRSGRNIVVASEPSLAN
jgi:diguanylate cyclase (GGDEF)-like protein